MKKEQKQFSELYSPEMVLKIDEVHSMIMEQSGDLNLSSLIPNWKNMKMGDLGKTIAAISYRLSESTINSINENSSQWSPEWWSPRWRRSKFGKMSMEEVREYAFSSPEKRKEVRDFVEEEYSWIIKNAPEGFKKRSMSSTVKRYREKGKDPFDYFYKGAKFEKSGVLAYVAMLTLILQILLWLLF